jgi:hypothetical protein
MKKVIGIIFILFIICIIPHCCNHLCSIGETPHATDCHERKWHGRDGELGYSYTFYTYYLYDTTRQCHLGNPETFYIMKKEDKIVPDDRCEHCNMEWSWHFKK